MSSKIQLISLFSLQLKKGYEEHAKENLDKFFEQHILVQKTILSKNIDPTTELKQVNQLYIVCQDILLYFKCLVKVQPLESQLLMKVKESLL